MSERALRLIEKEKKERTGTLDLSYCNLLLLPDEISKLPWLRSLYLRSNKISNIESLKNLKNLSRLDLRSNKIIDDQIQILENLKALISLDISQNPISNIQFLEGLTNIHNLNLSFNPNIKDFLPLTHLQKLQKLELQSNEIINIHFLKNLSNLINLNISFNKIIEASSLEKLLNLEYLDLSNNQITDVEFLENLTNITYLNLDRNNIRDISSILNIIKKDNIYVSKEGYKDGNINLFENPIGIPPLEVVKDGTDAILRYFKELEYQGTIGIYEAKLIIVGGGESGKTTLAWKLNNIHARLPKKGVDRTYGIDIQLLEIDNIATKNLPFRINIWDFGGQVIYHSIHQFFLTKRSLYILVNNTRSNTTDFNYWLQTINLFSDNSPVIIVQNQVAGSPTDLDLRGLQGHFSNILYVKDTDLSNIKDGRLQFLIRDIKLDIQRLPHVGSELPKLWVAVRNALQEKAKAEPFISAGDFYTICKENKIEDKNAVKHLGGFLHDLGVFLHFQDDPVLKYTVILQNSWATKGVYTILDDKRTRKRNGHFSEEEAQKIWAGTEFEDMHHELLQLMRKFELCYEIPNIQPTQYVSPQLLPIEKPVYVWDNSQNLILYYDYEFMPKGLMGRLIVRLHRYIKDVNTLAWRNGCIFTYENTDAQVIETYGNKKIEIRVRGKNCVRLSSIIIREIDELNARFERIRVAKMVPCNCEECSANEEPHFYEYKSLMNRKTKGKPTIECDRSFEDVSVKQILDGVYDENAARKKGIPELVGVNRISEALALFYETHPDEAAVLSSRYNEAARMYYLEQLPHQKWIQIRDQISQGILALYKMEPSSEGITGSGIQSINDKLDEIKSHLNQQDLVLNRIYEQTGANQLELLDLLEQLQENPLPDDYINQVVDVIERGMTDFQAKFPQAGEILDAWKTASQQLKLTSDSKAKLKFTIPFVFCSIEKEYAWNGWDWFRSIKEDIRKGRQGKWHEMFVE